MDEVGNKLVDIVKAIKYCPKVSKNILVRCYKPAWEEVILYLQKSIMKYFKFTTMAYEVEHQHKAYGYKGRYDQFIMIIDVYSSNKCMLNFVYPYNLLGVLLPQKVITCKQRPMEIVEL